MSSIKFTNWVFYCILSFFLIFVCCFVAFQYHREKQYKIELVSARLEGFNRAMGESVSNLPEAVAFYKTHCFDSLRVTILDPSGKPVYDSVVEDAAVSMPSHADRKEVQRALELGIGFDTKRCSQTMGRQYFYCATYFADKEMIIRSSLPYDMSLVKMLSADNGFLWFALVLTAVLMIFCYAYVRRIGLTIAQLKTFSEMAERSEDISRVSFSFPDNDLGAISKNIVRLYSQLQNSEDDKTRLKRQLTQNIAHELKTPVSSIQGYLETISSDPDMDPATKELFLSRCYAQSTRLSSLLADISVLSKMEDSSQSFDSESVNIHSLVEGVMADVALQLQKKKMTMWNLTPSELCALGNQQLLYSIFRNLTDNSLAYAGDGATITVNYTGSQGGGLLKFVFSDNGVGVAPEHLPHLFERFYRVDKGRSRMLGGTGLGLAIVKNAVILHGGAITVSLSPTGGLRFDFTLRAAAQH